MTQVKDSSTKNRNCSYEFFLFCEPYFLLLENDSIIDANLSKSEKTNIETLVIETEDIFFQENIKIIESKDFSITLQSYDENGNFLYQIDSFGEDFYINQNKIVFECQSLLTNQVKASLNPLFNTAIDIYKKERVSYIRNSRIETVLN